MTNGTRRGLRGQRHAPAALYPRKRPGTFCTGGWVDPRTGLDRCGKSPSPTGIRSPHRPARSQSLYRLSYRTHIIYMCYYNICFLETGKATRNLSIRGKRHVFESHISGITRSGPLKCRVDPFGFVNPLNPELNPIFYLLALLAHHFLHVSRIRF